MFGLAYFGINTCAVMMLIAGHGVPSLYFGLQSTILIPNLRILDAVCLAPRTPLVFEWKMKSAFSLLQGMFGLAYFVINSALLGRLLFIFTPPRFFIADHFSRLMDQVSLTLISHFDQ